MNVDIGNFALQDGLSRSVTSLVRLGVGQRRSKEEDAGSIRQVAQDFAAFLMFELTKAMRATIPKGGLLETNASTHEAYTSMADMELARVIAQQGGAGLTDFIERALSVYDQGESTRVSARFPADGVISSAFGMRSDPIHGKPRLHAGIDIAAAAGSLVKAMAAGQVVFSGQAKGYGNLVSVDHGHGMVTRYAHNATNLVGLGEQVALGQEIARIGTSGRSTGPHLHFEILRDGTPIDPQSYFRSQAH